MEEEDRGKLVRDELFSPYWPGNVVKVDLEFKLEIYYRGKFHQYGPSFLFNREGAKEGAWEAGLKAVRDCNQRYKEIFGK